MLLNFGLSIAMLSAIVSTFFFGSILSDSKMKDDNGKFTHTFLISTLYMLLSFFCACYIGSILNF